MQKTQNNEADTMSFAPSHSSNQNDWPNIIVIGRTQQGKSTFINRFMGKIVSEEGDGRKSCTKQSKIYSHPGKMVNLIDTPGLGDSDKKMAEESVDILANEMQNKNICLFLFVMKGTDMFDEATQNTITNLKYMFQQESTMQKFACLLTFCDVKKLKYYDRDLAETKTKVKEDFLNVANWNQEPAYIWPVSFWKKKQEDSFDENDQRISNVIEHKFNLVREEIVVAARQLVSEKLNTRKVQFTGGSFRRESDMIKKGLERILLEYYSPQYRAKGSHNGPSSKIWKAVQNSAHKSNSIAWDKVKYENELKTNIKNQELLEEINEDVDKLYKIQEAVFNEMYKNWLTNAENGGISSELPMIKEQDEGVAQSIIDTAKIAATGLIIGAGSSAIGYTAAAAVIVTTGAIVPIVVVGAAVTYHVSTGKTKEEVQGDVYYDIWDKMCNPTAVHDIIQQKLRYFENQCIKIKEFTQKKIEGHVSQEIQPQENYEQAAINKP